MRKINLKSTVNIAMIVATIIIANPINAYAATSPTLTGSASYSVLGAEAVSNTGLTTTTGNVGVATGTAITGFPPGIAGGNNATYIHSNDASAIAAQSDNLITFGALDQGCDHSYASGQDLTLISPLIPGVYCSAGSFLLSGNLTLSGSGVWIFKAASTITTSPNSSVTGGDPCNVWWRIGSSATLNTTTSFIGNILALTSITLDTGATLNGRALAQTGAVTLDSNTITGATCTTTDTGTPDTSGTTDTTTPKLPNTGYNQNNNFLLTFGSITAISIIALIALFITRRKQNI
jgi:LPXTG-motif cell wall-anchored protein